jgi:Flp pilus assembly protein TadG
MLKDESGNVLVLTALCSTLLISFLALAVDIGNLYYTQRQLQTLADSAAMAGALAQSGCSANDCAVITTAAVDALTEGGAPSPTLFKNCAATSGTGLLLTVNNPPCAVASDPNNTSANYVEAVVSYTQPTFFAGIFGHHTMQISARAEAGKYVPSGGGPCLNSIGASGQTLTLNSGAKITDANGSTCGMNVNSGASPAVMEDAGATVTIGSYTIHGTATNNGALLTPAPTTGSAIVPDPFASLTVPTVPGASSSCCNPISGATTLQPGYFSSGLNFNGSGYTVTLNPGLYYFANGLNIGGINFTSTSAGGVTIYIAGGQLNMNSASQMSLTAPTAAQISASPSDYSGCTSACAGMLIWQSATDSSAVNLDSASGSSWGGAVYLPDAQLTLNGGSYVTSYGMVVANTVMVNSAISLSCASMPGGVCPGGSGGGGGSGSTTISLAE